MTILSTQALVNVLDLIADGATTVEAMTAIEAAPRSKILWAWLADSEGASEFGSPPDPESKWCIEWGERPPEWFHILYRQAVADGREARANRKSPIRADLEARLTAKRASAPTPPPRAPMLPVMLPDPPRPPAPVASHPTTPAASHPTVPAYAFKRAPRLDGEDREHGPPSAGRFTVATKRYSLEERQAGLPEITETGIRYH